MIIDWNCGAVCQAQNYMGFLLALNWSSSTYVSPNVTNLSDVYQPTGNLTGQYGGRP